MTKKITIEQINDVLPQTQCGLCSYAGCKPYATAIIEKNESINRCPPGGVEGLMQLGHLTGIDPTPFIEEMQNKQKPKMVAIIREDQCIGCTKCIQACPVDAILGAGKLMHTVIGDECTGCELCVEPCPVDCIDMLTLPLQQPQTEQEKRKQAQHYKQRYEFREQRLAEEKHKQRAAYLKNKAPLSDSKSLSQDEKRRFIAEALARVKEKKTL